MSGAFIVNRELFQSSLWSNIVDFRLYMLILSNAVYAEEGVNVGGIRLQRGQWLRSIRKLQTDLEYIENRAVKTYSTSVISRSLERLVKENLISIHESELGTVHTVLNYAKDQDFSSYKNRTWNSVGTALEQPENSDGTAEEQRWNNNNKGNKENEGNKEIVVVDDGPDDSSAEIEIETAMLEAAPAGGDSFKRISDIEAYFRGKRGKGLSYSPSDLEAIQHVFKENIPVEFVKTSLDEIFKNYKPKYTGDEIRGFGYCSPIILAAWDKHKRKEAIQRGAEAHERDAKGNRGSDEPATSKQSFTDRFTINR